MNQGIQKQIKLTIYSLVTEENKGYDIKAVLQKQIKQLTPEEYNFFSFLIATNHVFEQLSNCQNKLYSDPTFSLWKLFEFFDVNKDKKIQLEDFVITLQKLDILLKREEIESLFSTLGGEDDNIISYAEFANLLKFSTAPQWRQTKVPQESNKNQFIKYLVYMLKQKEVFQSQKCKQAQTYNNWKTSLENQNQ